MVLPRDGLMWFVERPSSAQLVPKAAMARLGAPVAGKLQDTVRQMPESTDHMQHVDVSREELYQQVWQTPMTQLAAQYGISRRGLAKVCDRLKVPYPPRG